MNKIDTVVNEHYVYHEGIPLRPRLRRRGTGDRPDARFSDDHRIYDKLAPLLSPWRVVTFDWLGYGRSDRTDKLGSSSDDHGSELEAVLDGLGITRAVLVGHDASGPDAVEFAVAHPERVAHLVLLNTIFGHQPSLKLPEMIRLLADPAFTSLADAMVNDDAQRLWLLQHTATQWDMDALDPEGIAVQSILPQFFGDADQPDAIAAIRAWTAELFDALDKQDALIDSGALRRLEVPVSIIFGEKDRYLTPTLGAESQGSLGTRRFMWFETLRTGHSTTSLNPSPNSSSDARSPSRQEGPFQRSRTFHLVPQADPICGTTLPGKTVSCELNVDRLVAADIPKPQSAHAPNGSLQEYNCSPISTTRGSVVCPRHCCPRPLLASPCSICRGTWPARTARCCWAIWAQTSSRSSPLVRLTTLATGAHLTGMAERHVSRLQPQ